MRLIFIFLLGGLILSKGQTAEDVVRQHLARSGGEVEWNKLNSIFIEGQVVFGVEKAVNLRIYHRRPYHKRVVYVIEGKEVLSEGYDGKVGWTFSEQLNTNIRIPNYKPDAFEDDLLNYKAKGFSVVYKSETVKNKIPCYAVELTKNKNVVQYCFDKRNYDLIWQKDAEEEVLFSDFKEFNGLRFATNLQAKTKQGGEYGVYFNTIVTNPALDDKLFKFKK